MIDYIKIHFIFIYYILLKISQNTRFNIKCKIISLVCLIGLVDCDETILDKSIQFKN